MIRIIIMIFFFFGYVCPVYSGELENSLEAGENIFLYLYTKNCGYCEKFNPVYKKIETTFNKNIKFIKIDAYTAYGRYLMKSFKANYVPYVVFINSKSNDAVEFAPNCLLSYSCSEKALRDMSN